MRGNLSFTLLASYVNVPSFPHYREHYTRKMIFRRIRTCTRPQFLMHGERRKVLPSESTLQVACQKRSGSFNTGNLPRTRKELEERIPGPYPRDLDEKIRRAASDVGRMLVVLDDDPTGTQTVHKVPVLADWSVDTLAAELTTPGPYRVLYLNTNARALTPVEASKQYEGIGRNIREASNRTGVDVSIVSRGDSTLRGHFPGDMIALEKGLGVRHEGWIVVPFFEAGGRITAGDVHYVEQQTRKATTPDGGANVLTPAGETEFARDAAFGYCSSNLVAWIQEKSAGSKGGGYVDADKQRVTSVSLHDLREGGPAAVVERLSTAQGGCVVVNAVERRDLQVFVTALLHEEMRGKRFLTRSAADFVAVRGAVDTRALLEKGDFEALQAERVADEKEGGGLIIVGSYVSKTTEQLEHALAATDAAGVELRAAEVVGEGSEGRAARDAEIARVQTEVSERLAHGRDVIVFTSRGVPFQEDGAGGLTFGERVGSALVASVAGITCRPRFLVSKGGITSSDIATRALGMTRAEVIGQILPGVPVWSMADDSRWPSLPLVVFPGNVGGREALVEAMLKLGARSKDGQMALCHDGPQSKLKSTHPYASGSGSGNRTLDILAEAKARGAAVGAFTVYNLEGIRAVVRAAEASGRSAILQAHPAALSFQRGIPLLKAAVSAARSCTETGGPLLSVQLDHGAHEEHILAALEAGVDSVMIDGSAMNYEDNVAWTSAMASKAHEAGVAVEAELGKLAGEEDGLSVPEVEAKMTDPHQVPDFLTRTGADILAVTIGNVHGRYARTSPQLDLPRLRLIDDAARASSSTKSQHRRMISERNSEGFPLAIHGASGLPTGQVRAAIDIGVCKFNVNTEVRTAAINTYVAAGKFAAERGSDIVEVDLLSLMDDVVTHMATVVEKKMLDFDCAR